MHWQAIETAPKDGTRILVWEPWREPECVRWSAKYNRWIDAHGEREDPLTYPAHNPTHWMPLPPPPTGTAIRK